MTLTPNVALTTVAMVNLNGVSFKMTQASAAVRNGIELHIKSVAATVVLVIAYKRHSPAGAKKHLVNRPGFPTAIIFCGARRPKRQSITPKMVTLRASLR